MSIQNGRTPLCPGCGGDKLRAFFAVDSAAANVGTLPASAAAARDAARGSIALVICERCELIHNWKFDVAQVGFQPGYEVSLFHTRVFREYIEGVCSRLIERYDLRGKQLLEIGCGGGDFLRLISRRGANHGVGIDPTIAAESHEKVGDGEVTFIPGFFGSGDAKLVGDFVCCLSVLEAIPQVFDFLRTLRECIGDRDVPMYFEVFNGFRSIEQREVWSIHYEQCNYFSLSSLTGLFERAGFEILRAGTCYQGDQYLYVEARPARPQQASQPTYSFQSNSLEKAIALTEEFEDDYRQRAQLWQERMRRWKAQETHVVVWGSGGKGISFLNALTDSDVVRSVVDVNPDRQQHFLPLSGHPIVAPTTLVNAPPDVVIVTNPLYYCEIEDQLRQLGIEAELLTA